jgi:glyoxylase I family protein
VNPEKQEQFGPKMAPTPFHHIALKCDGETQNQVKQRLAVANYHEPQIFVFKHGYNGCSIPPRKRSTRV